MLVNNYIDLLIQFQNHYYNYRIIPKNQGSHFDF